MAEGKAVKAAPVAPDPIARIDAILAAEKPAPEKRAAQAPEKVAEPEQPAEAQPEEEAQPNKVVEGEETPQEDAQPGVEMPEDQLHELELEVKEWSKDGKRVLSKRKIKELREGYMRLDDYSRNIQEVAKQREELSKSTREAVEGERSQYAKNLQELQTVLLETVAPELKDVNWNDLAKNDPFKYVELRNRADQITQALSKIQGEQTQLSAKQQTEQKELRLKEAQKTLEVLQADIPNWGQPLYQNLLKAGVDLGYRQE